MQAVLKKGTIGIRVLSLDLKPDLKLNSQYLIRIKHGYQISDITSSTLSDKIWYDYTSETLQITINNRSCNSNQIGYAEVKLTQIMNYPDCYHKIHIYPAIKSYNQWLEKEAGYLVLEFQYYSKPIQGKLKITVVKADLKRNTQTYSKMDPFVKIKYLGKQYTTKYVLEAGKNPEWNEQFEIDVFNLLQRIEFIVYDKDQTSDDLIGSVDFKLRQSRMLTSTNKIIDHNFELLYKQNPQSTISAGILNIRTKFTPS